MTGTSTTFELCFPPVADNLGHGRQAISRWLAARSVDAGVVHDLAVVYSELAANALAASNGDDICTQAWIDGGEVVIEVANGLASSDARRVTRWDLGDPLRGGGRGLMIVRAFTDDVEVVTSDDGQSIVVRCRRRIA